MTLSERLKDERKKAGLSQKEFAEKLGLNARTYASYERGERDISTALLLNICKTLNISSDRLLGNQAHTAKPDPPNAVRLPQEIVRMVPLYESVAAGFGAYADSSAVGIIPCCIESDWEAENSIGIKVKGDSMYPKIEDGDIVVVCKDMDYDDGQIVVARIDEDDAVVKRIHLYPTRLVLESINPEYQDRVFEREEMNRVHIEGVVRKIVKNV